MKRLIVLSLLGFVALGFAAMATNSAAQPSAAQTQTKVQSNTTNTLGLGKHDANAPIAVSADNFLGDFQTKVGTYSGNVLVSQGDMKLRADKVKVLVADGKPNKIEAVGNIVFSAPSGSATGDNGVYDLGPRTITLTGRVVLSKEKNVMKGTLLVINLVTGEAKLTASGMPGGRVQGLFQPPPKSTSSSSPK
ncbi:MAG: lipopolysaccharide transport periplasmic protein LptA [Proteobacteria bacterium]|nr:lipopolysaccharide transport periplasmic protein LptA [Pseudomonadota bacterium]